jgi:UDP-glucose 4-epimerase
LKKILITGCCGFIGSSLVKRLIDNHKIYGIDDFSSGKKIIKHKNFKFIQGKCEDPRIFKKIYHRIDYIYHLCGQSSGEKSFYNPLDDVARNLLTTVNLLEFYIKNKCKRFIFTSSMSVYGDSKKTRVSEKDKTTPKSFYGLSKLCSEEYIKKYYLKGVNYTILRLFNVIGEDQSLDNYEQGMLRIYLSQVKNTEKLLIKGSKNRFRDFIHIDEVLNYLEEAPLNNKAKNQTINVGSGKKVHVRELEKILKNNVNKKFKTFYKKSTPLDQFGIYSNNSKLQKIFKIYAKTNIKKKIANLVKSHSI